MKTILLALLLCAGTARADSITNLAGKIHQGSETFTYQFVVDEYTGSLFDTEVLNGSVLTQYGAIGCHPCSVFYVNDIYEFLPTESIVLASFGNWNLVGSASGAVLVDPPTATPEPMTLVLLFTGALWLLAIGIAETRDTYERRQRDYPYNHIYRKV